MSQCHICHGIVAMSLLILVHSWILVGILLQLQLQLPQSVCVWAVPYHCVLGFGCGVLALCEFYISLIACYLPSWTWFASTFPAHCQICLEQPWLLILEVFNCGGKSQFPCKESSVSEYEKNYWFFVIILLFLQHFSYWKNIQ